MIFPELAFLCFPIPASRLIHRFLSIRFYYTLGEMNLCKYKSQSFSPFYMLETNAEICGFVVSAKHRNDVFLKSPIFCQKSWELDRNTSRVKPDLINYAVYTCGSAQLRLFETKSVPDKTVFYFVNMCSVDENFTACPIGWLEERGYIQEYSPPFNVVTCSSCNLKGHNCRAVTCPRKVACPV